MSDTLIGVIVGALIASIAPITTLITDHFRWKREANLTHLKSERERLQQLYTDALERLSEAMKENIYPSDMLSDIYILMPKNVSEEFDNWMNEQDKTPLKGKHAYLAISVEMKRSLTNIDTKINDLVSN